MTSVHYVSIESNRRRDEPDVSRSRSSNAAQSSSLTRRGFIARSLAALSVTDAELNDLRRRILATRFPEKEPVADPSQGVQLAFIQALARYWATDYNWRRCEAQLNSHPQFITEIDGLDIHFIHVRSRHEDAMPLIVTHGWPGSVIELRPPPIRGIENGSPAP